MKKHFGHRLIKKAAKPLPYKPSPRGEGCDTRIPSSKKAAIPPACETIRPRISSS